MTRVLFYLLLRSVRAIGGKGKDREMWLLWSIEFPHVLQTTQEFVPWKGCVLTTPGGEELGAEGWEVRWLEWRELMSWKETTRKIHIWEFSLFSCACWELSGMLSECLDFFLVSKRCQGIAQCVGQPLLAKLSSSSGSGSRAGSRWLSQSTWRQGLCYRRADLGTTRMRAAAPLQVMLGGGWRAELRLPTRVRNTHIPGWDVAKSYFPGMQTWGREDAKTIEGRGKEGERGQKNAAVWSETLRLDKRPRVGVFSPWICIYYVGITCSVYREKS